MCSRLVLLGWRGRAARDPAPRSSQRQRYGSPRDVCEAIVGDVTRSARRHSPAAHIRS